jgi:molybdenum cofactor cytidylyltransferase
MSGRVAAVVLAAGLSERMGRPKQLLQYRETTVIDHVVQQVETSLVDEAVVVVGAHAPAVVASLSGRDALITYNPRFRQGNLTSLLTGIDAAGDCDAVVLVLGDMPGIDRVAIDALVSGWRSDPHEIAVTKYDDGIGHPFLLSAVAIERIASLQGAKPLWGMITGLDSDRRLCVRLGGPQPIDLDTPADYAALLAADQS